MEEMVLWHPSQEVPSSELNFSQQAVKDSLDQTVLQLLVRSVFYKGMTVTKNSATELKVAAGRYWFNGKCYVLRSPGASVNLTSYLPAGANKKYLVIVASGSEIETEQAPRKFLVDPTTRAVRSRTVATRVERNVNIAVIEGNESLAPTIPAVDVGYAKLATVLISASGVVGDPEQVLDQIAPNLEDTVSLLTITRTELARQLGLIKTLRAELAGLARMLREKADKADITRLDLAMRDVREAAGVPDTASLYGWDSFGNEDESDTEHADYQATVGSGVLGLPAPALVQRSMALLNPLDPKVKIAANGLVLPDYDEEIRLDIDVQEQELAIATYPVVVQERVQKSEGYLFKWFKTKWGGLVEKTMAKTGGVVDLIDPETGNKITLDLDKYHWEKRGDFGPGLWIYISDFRTYWTEKSSTVSVTGATVGQTTLNAQAGWLTAISLKVKEKGGSGDVRLIVCECNEDGTPELKETLGEVTVPYANISLGWTKFTLGSPVHLSRGVKYGVIVKTGGAHKLWTSNTNDLANGTMFYSLDADYWEGLPNRDLAMRMHFAKFKSTMTVVDLEAVSVAGGISEMDFTCTGIYPAAADFDIQARIGSVWRNIDANNQSVFATEPNLVPLRAVWQNTPHDAVGITISKSRIFAYKPDTTGVHVSKARTLPDGTTAKTVVVEEYLEGYGAGHTHAVKLLHGASFASTKTPAATTVTTMSDGRKKHRTVFDFTGAEIGAYKIRTEMSVSSAHDIYVVTDRYDYATP